MKTKVTLTIDNTQLFDTIVRVGNETAGNRFVDLLLSIIANDVGMRIAIGAALYGIEIDDVKRVKE